MKTIELTKEQREQLVDALADVRQQYGDFEIEIVIGCDLIIEAKGNIEVEAYQEDDYFNGTGAWIETYRNACIELKAIVYGEEDYNEYYVDAATEQAAEKYLNEAA